MKITPPLEKMILESDKNLKEALKVINNNSQGICFIIKNKKPIGVLTDGDIRRLLIKNISLDNLAIKYMVKNFITLPSNADNKTIQQTLSTKIRHIPLVDKNGKIVDYACQSHYHNIPLAQPMLEGNELAYVTDCINSSWISSQGKYVNRFEIMLSEYTGIKNPLAVSNGTVALQLALTALEVGSGDEVIVPDFTFAASINAIIHSGAKPVLVDVDVKTWTIDVKEIKKAITKKTKAIMPVHLYGHPCDMRPIKEIAKNHKLFIIEDCAEALGSFYRGRHVGCFGDAATFSFFGNKTITTGEGGMILFRNQSIQKKARQLRDHGMNQKKRYWHDYVGYNFRLTNLQAAIGVAQMERVDYFVNHKRQLAKKYQSALKGVNGITLPIEKTWAKSSYWLYTILVNNDLDINRDDLIQKLLLKGIETRPVFISLHKMPLYAQYGKGRTFVNSESISNRGISLPSHSSLSKTQVQKIAKVIDKIIKKDKKIF